MSLALSGIFVQWALTQPDFCIQLEQVFSSGCNGEEQVIAPGIGDSVQSCALPLQIVAQMLTRAITTDSADAVPANEALSV